MTKHLTQSLKAEAKTVGFDFVGVCAAVSPVGYSHLEDWLNSGFHGEMDYIENRKEAYRHPSSILDGAKSVVMLAMNYQSIAPQKNTFGFGRVSRYAWSGTDYHDLIHAKLKRLAKYTSSLDEEIDVRGIVDTAPLLEREFAQLCGLGWQAKNTMLINRDIGSWFFLAALILNKELEYDFPFQTDHCGSCTSCLDACPTDAFVGAKVLDAQRCISYLTIELKGPIPREFRNQVGDWVFGCDVCQDVCPWNNKAKASPNQAFLPDSQFNPLNLRELFDCDDEQFRHRFRKTPLWRSKRRGILRNAAIVLGNSPCDENLVPLHKGLYDMEPLVRGASAWALSFHDAGRSLPLLQNRLREEKDLVVIDEINFAIQNIRKMFQSDDSMEQQLDSELDQS